MIGPKPNASSSAAPPAFQTFAKTAIRASKRMVWPTAWNRLVHDDAPIFVGPFLGEVGFEALYWVPFVAHLRNQYRIDPARFIILTRGGAGCWYQGAGRSIELYDYLPMSEFRLQLWDAFQESGSVKQMGITPMERHLLQFHASRLGIRRYHVLHPSVMYHALEPWWSLRMTVHQCLSQLRFDPLGVPALPVELHLPEPPYIAVKFYTRPTWPATEALRTWSQDLVTRLVQNTKQPVVLLDSGLPTDEHGAVPIPTTDRIYSLAGQVTPQNNLAIQTSVLAKASAFVGTYGGTMQLAVRLGLPSAGFYEDFKKTAYAHKFITEVIGVQAGRPVFIGRPTDGSFIDQVMG